MYNFAAHVPTLDGAATPSPGPMLLALPKSYSVGLVGLSIVIAILASLTALDVVARVHVAEGRVRLRRRS